VTSGDAAEDRGVWNGPPEPGPLRILLLEDDPWDAELTQRMLAGAGLDFTAVVVDEKAAFTRQLADFRPQVILSGFSLPGFSGASALKIARAQDPHTPFILSGAMGDEAAVELIRQGAMDYILKDRPGRLASVVRRAVDEAVQGAQRARLEAQLQQSQRLESLGQLAGGVAHDFNNLLGVIASYASFAGQEVAKEPSEIHWEELRGDIGQIERAVQRATGLTRQLLAFGRREVVHPQVLNLNDVVADVTELLVRTLGEHVELITIPADDLVPVFADPGQMEQVMVNLAVNARDAMPGGGTLTIATANTNLDEEYAAGRTNLQPGGYVSVKVSDTGTGMPLEVQERVFEPFFTTKPKGEGTGLGLATVYGIITQAGGAVRIYSEPGLGTTLTVLLPYTDRDAQMAPSSQAEPEGGAGKVVLVVEDEAALREVTRRMLDRAGYRVLTAASGLEALDIAAREQGPIDVLLTDVVMPHILGREVSDRLRALQPGVRVLFMSGYAHGLLSAQGVLERGLNLIEKPFTQAALLTKLAKVLAEAPG
jgi:two-component system cell cycle sensor histidine kinase/response regulator CckA